MSKFFRIGLKSLAVLTGLIVLLIVALNLPVSKKFVSRQVNGLFARLELPLHIRSVEKVRLKAIQVEGFSIVDPQGDTLIYAGHIEARYKLLALTRSQVILKEVRIKEVQVRLLINEETHKLTLAEAFSKGKRKKPVDPEKQTSSWKIALKSLHLSSLYFQMEDPAGGMYILEEVQEAKVKRFILSLAERELLAHTLELTNTRGEITLDPRSGVAESMEPKKKEDQPSPEAPLWNYGVRNLALQHMEFSFDHKRDSLKLKLLLDKGNLSTNQLDLARNMIDVKELSLDGLHTALYTGKESIENEGLTVGTVDFPWDIKTAKLDLKKVSAETGLYGLHHPDSSAKNLALEDLNLRLRDLELNKAHAELDLKKLRFKLSNGFILKNMDAEFVSDSVITNLNLALETGNSSLSMECSASEGLFDLLGQPPDAIPAARVDIHQALISVSDLTSFYPEMKEMPAYPFVSGSPFKLEARMDQKNSTIQLERISLSQEPNFQLLVTGSSENSFDAQKASGNLNLNLSEIHMPWLKALLSAYKFETTLPDSTQLELGARLSNRIRTPEIEVEFFSNQGEIRAEGNLDLDQKKYRLRSEFGQVELGDILAKPALGSFTGSAEISGSGFSMESFDSQASLQIDSLFFNDYTYTQTHLKGLIRPGEYEITLLAEDPSLNGSLDLFLQDRDSIFSAQARGRIFAQLDRLHFYQDTLAVESHLQGSFTQGIELIESEAVLKEITLHAPEKEVTLERFMTRFRSDSISTNLRSEADFISLDLEVGKQITDWKSLREAYINYAQSFIDPDTVNDKLRVSFLPETKALAYLTYHDAMGIFIEDPEFHFSHLDLSVINQISEKHMDYQIQGRGFKNKILKTEDLNVMLNDSAGLLNLSLTLDSFSLSSGPLNHIHLKSQFARRKSMNELTVYDSLNQVDYNLEIASQIDSNLLFLTAPTQQVVLNQRSWELESPELVWMDLTARTFHPALSMQSDSSLIQLTGLEKADSQSYIAKFKHLDINSLLPETMIPGNPGGFLSGTVEYSQKDSTERNISSDLRLNQGRFSDLKFNDFVLDGFFTFRESGENKAGLLIRMDSARMELKGENLQDQSRLIQASYSKLPLNILEPFTEAHISNLRGTISGDLSMGNSGSNKLVEGYLAFDDASLRVNTLNSTFRIPKEDLRFSGEKLLFNKFRVLDSLDKALLVDGSLDFNAPGSVTADLHITSDRLQIMNRKASQDVPLYGSIFVDSRIDAKGPLTNPMIDGRIFLKEGTEVFYQHQENLSVTESSKYVNFVIHDEDKKQSIENHISSRSAFSNSSIKTVVEIDPSTRIHFNLEKRIYEIKLSIQGGGVLNYGMLNRNQMSLSGNYSIGEGSCELRLVGWPDKTFEISEGGFVRWDGNIEDPELNLRAVNKVASSYQNPVDGKQRNVDFNVILQLSQHLSDLDIVLTFDTQDQYLMSIINTLSPEDQMRQAITILLFETVDLPGISTTSDYMSQQVNQIVASQLNQLTQSTIKGVDISFGLDTYDQVTPSGGKETTTSLSYEVSKSFMNDRATIEVSGRLSDLNDHPSASDMTYNNISFEYRLDSAATKYLNIYTEHSYEDVFEGEVVRTGVGVHYRKRFSRLRDIWKRKDKEAKPKKTGL